MGARHYRGAALVHHRAREADVVYTTGMFGRSALGASLARRPYVVKLTADPAFERSRRRGLTEGNVDEFQRNRGGGAPVAFLRFARDVELRHAAHVFTPSAYLRELALAWGVDPGRVSVLPNPAPAVPALPPREELRAGLGLNGSTIAFAGRLTAQKSLERALEAVAGTDDVRFLIAGDGPDRAQLEGRARALGIEDRVRFSRRAAPRARRRALPRRGRNDPVVELGELPPHGGRGARGRDARARDGGRGRRRGRARRRQRPARPAGDTTALAGAVSRYFSDAALRDRLRGAAAASVERYAPEVVFGELEAKLLEVARR